MISVDLYHPSLWHWSSDTKKSALIFEKTEIKWKAWFSIRVSMPQPGSMLHGWQKGWPFRRRCGRRIKRQDQELWRCLYQDICLFRKIFKWMVAAKSITSFLFSPFILSVARLFLRSAKKSGIARWFRESEKRKSKAIDNWVKRLSD